MTSQAATRLETPPAPLGAQRPGVRTVALHGGLWRITRLDGTVIGHVRLDAAEGAPFVAMRFVPRAAAFRELGRFWSAGEALDALRFA